MTEKRKVRVLLVAKKLFPVVKLVVKTTTKLTVFTIVGRISSYTWLLSK